MERVWIIKNCNQLWDVAVKNYHLCANKETEHLIAKNGHLCAQPIPEKLQENFESMEDAMKWCEDNNYQVVAGDFPYCPKKKSISQNT